MALRGGRPQPAACGSLAGREGGRVVWRSLGPQATRQAELGRPTHATASSLQGAITVQGLVDREKGDFYTLTVVADDGGPKVDSTVVSGCHVALPNPGHRPAPRARQWARAGPC